MVDEIQVTKLPMGARSMPPASMKRAVHLRHSREDAVMRPNTLMRRDTQQALDQIARMPPNEMVQVELTSAELSIKDVLKTEAAGMLAPYNIRSGGASAIQADISGKSSDMVEFLNLHRAAISAGKLWVHLAL